MKPETVRQIDDALHQHECRGLLVHRRQQRPVDFQPRKGQFGQSGKVGIADTKIVNRQRYSDVMKLVQILNRQCWLTHGRVFGHLDLQQLGWAITALKMGSDKRNVFKTGQLLWRNIGGNHQRQPASIKLAHIRNDLCHAPFVERSDQMRSLQHVKKLGRAQGCAVGMVPPHQSFGRDHLRGAQIENWLEHEFQLLLR